VRRIGVDVGGTNTDAVLVDTNRVLAAVKKPTSKDVTSGIVSALSTLLDHLGGEPGQIDAVVIGTTHFTNAVVQRQGLEHIGALRIGLPSGAAIPPFADWPKDLSSHVRGCVIMVEGGHEYDGRPFMPLDESDIRQAAKRFQGEGINSVAITSVFSPLTSECEERAAEIFREISPDIKLTLSHNLGRVGLLERENAALLNASLRRLAESTTLAFTEALHASGIKAPLYLTQNDGTVMRADQAEAFPVYSFSSGPTNSMRGAAHLSGLDDAMVVDVGGTTTDIGHLKAGFPREANTVVHIGGVRTLFRMPDLLSIGLGGGSTVNIENRTVGPVSVGYGLSTQALVFGGDQLTATDIGVAAGLSEIGSYPPSTGSLDQEVIGWAMDKIHEMIVTNVDRMKVDALPIPLLAVGGGAFLVPNSIPGISEVIQLEHGAVANAVGAAIAQVSGEVDQVFSGIGREEALERASDIARDRAAAAGANRDDLRIIDIEDLPLAYLPGDARRVRVKVVGETASE